MNIFKDEELWDDIPIFSLSNEEAEEELEMRLRTNCQKFEMFDAGLISMHVQKAGSQGREHFRVSGGSFWRWRTRR